MKKLASILTIGVIGFIGCRQSDEKAKEKGASRASVAFNVIGMMKTKSGAT